MDVAAFISFLIQAFVISFTGVLAPGPVTAATLELGARNRHAGALVAVGHGIVEFPLMVLIVLGMGYFFKIDGVRIAIGFAGGAMLLAMAVGMLRGSRRPVDPSAPPPSRGPVATGVLLSIGNPYFLLWWATVGLGLAGQAAAFGVLAFAVFAVLHWLCDLVWLEVLSQASFRGSKVMGPSAQRGVLVVCGAALVLFGGRFIVGAAAQLWSLAGGP